MVLFKKQKKQLRDFLNKHEGNPFITIPVQFAVGLVYVIAFVLVMFIVCIPLGFLSEAIGPGWTIGVAIAAMLIWLVGFMTCTEIQTHKP